MTILILLVSVLQKQLYTYSVYLTDGSMFKRYVYIFNIVIVIQFVHVTLLSIVTSLLLLYCHVFICMLKG